VVIGFGQFTCRQTLAPAIEAPAIHAQRAAAVASPAAPEIAVNAALPAVPFVPPLPKAGWDVLPMKTVPDCDPLHRCRSTLKGFHD
jgi:hypothetical protein